MKYMPYILVVSLLVCLSCSPISRRNSGSFDPRDAAADKDAEKGVDEFSVDGPSKLNEKAGGKEPADTGHESKERVKDDTTDEKSTVQAADEMWKKRLENSLNKLGSSADEEKIFESNRLYEQAKAMFDRGRYTDARDLCIKALDLWQGNHKARELLARIDETAVRKGDQDIGDSALEAFKAQIEGAMLEIAHHLKQGQRYFSSGEYDRALKEFREAEFKILAVPEGVEGRGNFEATIKDYVGRISAEMESEARKKQMELQQKSMAEQQALAEVEKKQVVEKIASLLDLAFLSFDQQQYDNVLTLCDKILDLDPNYIVAKELKEDAYKSKEKYGYREITARKILGWKAMLRDTKEASIPYQDLLQFPSRKKWGEVLQRAEELSTRQMAGKEEIETEDMRRVKALLETNRIDLEEATEATLSQIVEDLHKKTELVFLIDPEASGGEGVDIESPMPGFRYKNITVKRYLELVLEYYNLDYYVDESGIVHITRPIYAKGKPFIETYNITDILFKVRDFAAEAVVFGVQDVTSALPPSNPLGDEAKESFSGSDIIDLIRNNIAPGTWEGDFNIELTENQILIVKHNRQVQKQIIEFLDKLRANIGLMVSISTSFVSAYDDLLQDIGINIFNQNTSQVVDYDIIGNLRNGEVVVDDFTVFGPGFTNNTFSATKTEGFDLRGHTFHSFVTANTLISSLNQAFNRDFDANIDPATGSGRIRNSGGLGLQYQVLTNKATQLVMRMVKKHSRATVVEAPKISVLNTRRGFLTQTRVTPYVRDYTVVPIGFTAMLDPDIGYFSDGLKLDIKALIGHDRKYVTMTIDASVAIFRGFRTPPFAAPISGATGNQVLLQLPWIQQESVRMSAIVPDKGALVIGGLKNLNEKIFKSGIPILENIPILSALFSRKAKIKENENIYILITPEVIDLNEREKDFID